MSSFPRPFRWYSGKVARKLTTVDTSVADLWLGEGSQILLVEMLAKENRNQNTQ